MLLRVRVGDEYFLQVFILTGSVANGEHHSAVDPQSPHSFRYTIYFARQLEVPVSLSRGSFQVGVD